MTVSASTNDIVFSIGPVPSPVHVAARKGWIGQFFRPCGVRPQDLGDLPASAEQHISHRLDNMFRVGGSVPALWARGNGAQTTVVGVVWAPARLSVLVRDDSPFASLADLCAARFALPVRTHWPVDFLRLGAMFMLRNIFRSAGLPMESVKPVLVEVPFEASLREGGTTYLARTRFEQRAMRHEIATLLEGRADFMLVTQGRGIICRQTERLRELHVVPYDGPWASMFGNSCPVVTTVSTALARSRPDIVRRWLRMELLAARWAASNRSETILTLSGVMDIPADVLPVAFGPDIAIRLTPRIDLRAREALRYIKEYFAAQGALVSDFPLDSWIDESFLAETRMEIEPD
jgi:ABC-type nitrate/sulfonate/bicarbonate transport system substrate-binding protein